MEQETTQELRVSFNTDKGDTVSISVPDINLNTTTSDTAVAILEAAQVKLTADSDSTIVQSTSGGNVIGIKDAYIINSVKTYLIKND